VVAERRAEQVVVTGWTRDAKTRKILDKVLGSDRDALDLTSEDVADGDRMVEIDVIIVAWRTFSPRASASDFLNLVTTQFSYFTSDHSREDGPALEAPGTSPPPTSSQVQTRVGSSTPWWTTVSTSPTPPTTRSKSSLVPT